MKTARTLAAAALGAGLVLMAMPRLAGAQTTHLKCHRVRDALPPLHTTVDLPALQTQFSDTGCKVGKARELCVPVVKQNVQPTPPRTDIQGNNLVDNYICYTLRCPKKPPDTQVTDQFGTRTETKYVSKMLCVPARPGNGVTTTTTTTTLLPPTTVPAATIPATTLPATTIP